MSADMAQRIMDERARADENYMRACRAEEALRTERQARQQTDTWLQQAVGTLEQEKAAHAGAKVRIAELEKRVADQTAIIEELGSEVDDMHSIMEDAEREKS